MNDNSGIPGMRKTIRVAVVQFPFLPVVFHHDRNLLSEPEGGINFWLLGGKTREDFPRLSSIRLPKRYLTHIQNSFLLGYLDWLRKTVDDILTQLIIKRDPDIILFPEYSLPIQIDEELESILIDHSEGRCIVGGAGSVCASNEEKKNRFVVINNRSEPVFGEKVIPSKYEKKIGIIGGRGPLIHQINLPHLSEEYRTIQVVITMCSDFIDVVGAGSDIQRQIIKEEEESGIEEKDILVWLIPVLSPILEDMTHDEVIALRACFSKTNALRKYKITALASPSFFGESRILSAPFGRDDHFMIPCKPKTSIVVTAEIPLYGLLVPTPTAIGDTNEIKNPRKEYFEDYITFENEKRDIGHDEYIAVDSEDLFSLVAQRIKSAITVNAIAFAKESLEEDSLGEIIKSSRNWKEFQKEIIDYYPNSIEGCEFSQLTDSDIIAICGVSNQNIYILVLDKLSSFMDDPQRTTVHNLVKHIINEGYPPPTLWDIEKKKPEGAANDQK
jgi:hypothetical protein